jgi:phosphoglycerate kinase
VPLRIRSLDECDVSGKRVLLRVDINSPIDPETGSIADETRIDKSIPTIRDLAEHGARLTIMAHQGDTLDYHNLVSLEEHAELLAHKLGRPVQFIDDVAGPTARKRIGDLQPGEILLLDNLRYLTEEVSTFETAVKLTPEQMKRTYLVRNLAPLFDLYVNDAFAAAHRNSPSMVAFQQLMPSAAGRLLIAELEALEIVTGRPARPCLFVLGGLKISDAFSMLRQVLSEGTADLVLTAGVTGLVMLLASGVRLGESTETFIADRSLDVFIPAAQEYLTTFPDTIEMPVDVAVERDGRRVEVSVDDLPVPEPIIDIGEETIVNYGRRIAHAATIFVNGPPGVYEREHGAEGTRRLWAAIAEAPGTTVIGGGDTVSSADRFIDTNRLDFVSTGGGALIRYLSGQRLPLLEAMTASAGDGLDST